VVPGALDDATLLSRLLRVCEGRDRHEYPVW
jgi:hypothetical protein